MPIRVTVSRPGRCPGCGRGLEVWGQASKARLAVRIVREGWEAELAPESFRVERWARGEKPRVVFAGEFPGWDALREIVEGVTA